MTSKHIYYCVYRITNKLHGKHYYGYKSSSSHPRDVIGVTYFSSQKGAHGEMFRLDQKNNPHNYVYKIVRIFDNKQDALMLEIKLHNKFDVKRNPKFYNRANQTSTGFDTTGTTMSPEVLCRISKSKTGKMWYTNRETLETKKYAPGTEPEGFIKGRILSQSQLERMRSGASGYIWIHNEITKETIMVSKSSTIEYPWRSGRHIEYTEEILASISEKTRAQMRRQKEPGIWESIREKIRIERKKLLEKYISDVISLLGYTHEIELFNDLYRDVYCDRLCAADLSRKYHYAKPNTNYPNIGTLLDLYGITPPKGKTGPK